MASNKLKQALRESAAEEFNIYYKQSETILWEPSESLNAEMETLFKQTKKHRRSVLKRGLLVAAVILLISATTISVFGISSVRNKVIDYFSRNKSNYFDLDYGYEEAGDIKADGAIKDIYTFNNLPDGFKMTSRNMTAHAIVTLWENEKGDTLVLQQGDGITTRSIDNERLEKTYETVGGITMDIYSEDGYALILWNTDKYTFSIDYFGRKSPKTLARFLAENISVEYNETLTDTE